MEEYRMILRHKDTQEAFVGYDFNLTAIRAPSARRKARDNDPFTHTSNTIRKRK